VYKSIISIALAFALLGSVDSDAQTLPAPLDATGHAVEMRMTQLESELANLRAAFCCSEAAKSSHQNKCKGGLEAGVSLFFAKPQMKESFQATVVDVATGTLGLVPFSFDNDISPRVWLGYFGDSGAGVRARYWQYDHNADPLSLVATPTTFPGVSAVTVIFPSAISTAAPGDVLSVGSGLEVHTLDIEGAMRNEVMGINMLVSAGFRWASMEQNFDSVVIGAGQIPTGALNWTRNFEGGGLTAAADAKKRIGGSAFAVFGSARGSLLYGEKELRRSVFGDVTPPSAATPPFAVLENADEVSGIFELALGGEWSRQTKNFGNFFVRGTYETQLWTAAGAPTLTFLGFDGVSLAFGFER
jgi:hypothetical protein